MPMFLDPQKLLPTCSSAGCPGCPLQERLHCHFQSRDLVRFFAFAFPPFILGGIGIARLNAWLLLPWIAGCFSYFGLVEIRVMYSHCPHYAESGTKTLQCWANYGSPKLWKYRSGPMTFGENIIFFAGLGPVAGFPLVTMVIGNRWLLLFLFVLLTSGMGILMARGMCARCMNFAYPFNEVEPATRHAFFARNPVVGQAWRSTHTD